MPAKLSTTVGNICKIVNKENAILIRQFYEFMQENGTSERHQNNNLKAIISFTNYIELRLLSQINDPDQIMNFLKTKVKNSEQDPDQRWKTTYNDYLHRIKHFFRWLHNKKDLTNPQMDSWNTPVFLLALKPKRSKRVSPYAESEIWDKDEFLSIIKYENYARNKAALALMWDLDARPHEITNLRIKNIRLKEKYGEGEIPFESKTGTGPILLTVSFPFVRDWLNLHPYRNEPDARLICNLHNGAPIKPEALHTMMNQLKLRIIRLIKNGEINGTDEHNKIKSIIMSKKFNPYCIRHSAITHDSDYLPEYALKKKVRWSMNSRQGSRYIKTRMGNELKNKILEYNGIFVAGNEQKKIHISTCSRCNSVNAFENKFCSGCSYPLTPQAYEDIKKNEDEKILMLEQKYQKMIEDLRDDMSNQIQQIVELVDLKKMK